MAQTPNPLTANDVSILFPMPRNESDLANLIPLATLSGPTGPTSARLWSDADFARIFEIAESAASKVDGTTRQIKLPDIKNIDAWFIAGIRIDPGAPGLSAAIISQFGQQPQVRFIAQPVTRTGNGQIQVHDIAVHLIFSFSSLQAPAQLGCLPKTQPDLVTFLPIVQDVVILRNSLAAGDFGGAKVDTGAQPLGVHPGLSGPSAMPFRDALKAMLEKHLSPARLNTSAIMALDNGGPEPWIFVAMAKLGPQFVPIAGPTLDGKQIAEMLSLGDSQTIMPTPKTNNLNPITCRSAFAFPPGAPPLPITDRKGVSTADFLNGNLSVVR